MYSRWWEASDSVVGEYLSWMSYSVTSPIVPNYEADQLVVEWVMWWNARMAIVMYTPVTDENNNEIADEDEDRYRVIVHYQYSRWVMATWDKNVDDLLDGQIYSVESPVVEYYTADELLIEWTIDWADAEITVTYTPNNDKNNNWIADEEEKEEWWQYSWWGGRKVVNTNTHTHGSANINSNEEEIKRTEKYDANYPLEFNEAYQFSYNNKVTTVEAIKDAKMYTPIRRIEMAKMLSYYAINVLWEKPDDTLYVSFRDVSDKMDAQYDNGVTLAYQLWIMWINMPNNKFRPNDYVTRWEFATALSRMVYWIDDGRWRVKYYEPHMDKLYNEWIISDINPKMKELRWYVMLMLMRISK